MSFFLLKAAWRKWETAVGQSVICGSYIMPLWKPSPYIAGSSSGKWSKKQSNYKETMSTIWGYVCIFGQEICNVFPSLWTLPGCPLEWLDNALLYPCRSLLACPFPHIMSGKICSLAAEGRWVLLVNLLVMLVSLPEPAGLSWTKPCLHDPCLLRESVLCRVGTYVRARVLGWPETARGMASEVDPSLHRVPGSPVLYGGLLCNSRCALVSPRNNRLKMTIPPI